MYIEPNSTIIMLHDVPLDSGYVNTLWFGSEREQANYFASKQMARLDNNTYQRHEIGRARISGSAKQYYDCNYMMFKNTSFGEKWFYAFVTGVEYVNNITTEISFKIDQLQSWLFEMVLEPVFIERQHTPTDNIGDNLVPENLDFGDIVTSVATRTGLFSKYSALVFRAIGDESASFNSKAMIGGIPTGITVYGFTEDADTGFTTMFNQMKALVHNNAQDEVVAIVMYPSKFLEGTADEWADAKYIELGDDVIPSRPTMHSGYKPRNNKLLTYPFTYLSVETPDATLQFKYERFNNGVPHFSVMSSISATPEIVLVPVLYCNTPNDFNHALSITNFPQIAFATDSYRAWIAQGGMTRTLGAMVTGGAMAIASGLTGNVGGAVMGLNSIFMAQQDVVRAQTTPDRAHGTPTGSAYVGYRALDFYFRSKMLTKDYAERIDKFFDRYGYAVNKLDVPFINARSEYTYIKTRDMHLGGSIPVTAEEEISRIFNNGITWWKNPNHVGDYSVTNRPLGGA